MNTTDKMVKKPDGVESPIWCSISKENMLRSVEGTAVYELEADENENIYFDGTKWDHVLNHMYMPKDEADKKACLHNLKAKGFKDEFSLSKANTPLTFPWKSRK